MRITRVAGAALLAGAAGLVGAAPASAADEASVSILHGVPGATVDVYANGRALLTNFTPGTLTDPVKLAPGSYDLKVTAAGAGANGAPVVEAKGVNVPANANITVVAHLSANGAPSLTPFVNDVSPVKAGNARLTVRHVAAAPAVDVRAGGNPVFTGLTNPNGRSAEVPAGTVSADVVLAGTSTVAIGPASLNLGEGTSTIVYAWGSAQQNNLRLAVQKVSGVHSAPGAVPAGTSGAAAESDAARIALAGFVTLGAAGVALAATRRKESTGS